MLLYVCFLNVDLYAQNLNIKGKAIDPDGNSLPGTAVSIKGTTVGAVGKHNRVFVLNMGGEASATFPSTPDMVFYISNIRFTK